MVIVPFDLADGAQYTEPVCDYDEEDDMRKSISLLHRIKVGSTLQ